MSLALPLVRTDALRLADWLELLALTATTREASLGDLDQTLKREGLDSNAIEQLNAAVSVELAERQRAANGAYPFEFDAPLLRTTEVLHPAYLFCLCLSYWKWEQEEGGTVFPRRLFEEMSTRAAGAFVGGDALRFGAPRDHVTLPAEFLAALDELCSKLGEGEGTRQEKALRAQDDGLDIVAWRDFPDRNMGKLVVLAQCASGYDWKPKLTDLQVEPFCEYWLTEKPASPLLRAFFVPHRIPRDEWEYANRYGGIVFDRCRSAYWAERAGMDWTPYIDWYESAMDVQIGEA